MPTRPSVKAGDEILLDYGHEYTECHITHGKEGSPATRRCGGGDDDVAWDEISPADPGALGDY